VSETASRAGRPTRYIALLRAINVGGRTVKMEKLRELFDWMGFRSVETFIASGNVIFESPARDGASLEKRIEGALQTSLGYEVATFIRTPAEMAAVATHQPFPAAEIALPDAALYVAFLRVAPTDEVAGKLLALRGDLDDLHVLGRELYWLARHKMNESKINNTVLERILGSPATVRNITTVRKLAAKYPSE